MFESDFDANGVQDTDDIEFLDTSDMESDVDVEVDDGFYHATHMSAEEVERIDEMWSDKADIPSDNEPYRASRNSESLVDTDVIEPYRATRQSDTQDFASDLDASGDTNDLLSPLSLEEQFASDVESMSFDDLRVEQERLDQLSQMEDLDIFASYDAAQNGKYDPELMTALTDGLPRETLEYLKAGLATGDPDVYDYFGLGNDEETGNTDFTRTRKR